MAEELGLKAFFPNPSARLLVLDDGQVDLERLSQLASWSEDIVLVSDTSAKAPEGVTRHKLPIGPFPAHLAAQASTLVVCSCTTELLESLLFSAPPFSRILILGPIKGIWDQLDCYSTIHYKNLELVFAGEPATNSKGNES